MIKEFKDFALRGNVIDIAVGMLIGAGISPIARSLIDDIVMPPIGWALGNVDFSNLFWVIKPGTHPGPYLTKVEAAKAGAVTINYGAFINTVLSFVVIAFVAFLIVKAISRLRTNAEATKETKEQTNKVCPFCLTVIPSKALKCAACTSTL